MTPLDPRQLSVLRVRTAIAGTMLLLLAVAADLGPLRETAVPRGAVPAAVALLAILAMVWLARRRYRSWSYSEDEDELHVRHGLMVRVRTVVPFGRVQHIDVAQGPIERAFGVATLILHTAGTRGASVPLPGLAHAEAERMRDRIRSKIRQELA